MKKSTNPIPQKQRPFTFSESAAAGYSDFVDNLSKDGIKETNNCTVLATAAAFGIPYEKADGILTRLGRERGKGFKFFDFLLDKATKKESWQGHKITRIHLPENPYDTRESGNKYREMFPKGIYFLVIKEHVYVLKNGEFIDCRYQGRKRVFGCFQVTKA